MRVHAQLFHQGVPRSCVLLNETGREVLAAVELSPDGARVIEVGLDLPRSQIDPLRAS